MFSAFLILPRFAPAQDLVLQLAGDIMLGGSALPTFRERGYESAFGPTGALLVEGDVNFANLEGPVTTRGRPVGDKQFTFRMEPEALDAIGRVGFNLVALANNHTLDQGMVGLLDTIAHLQQRGIAHAGAGEDLAAARAPAILTVRGLRVGLLAYSAVFPPEFYALDDAPGTAFAKKEYLEQDIPAAREKVDLLIVSFHWGEELSPTPKEYQVELAHLAVDRGADVVVGHHPHVLQGIEVYRDRPIFYSLGNFAFSSYSAQVRDGLLARIIVHEGKPAGAWLIPLSVFTPDNDIQPRPLAGEAARDAIRRFADISAPFGTPVAFCGGRGFLPIPSPKDSFTPPADPCIITRN